jgi:uncharacterized protein (DUF1015 family)
LDATGPNDTRHTIWRIAEPRRVAEIGAAFEELDALYIADGHHRSAAALRVAEARRKAAAGSAAARPSAEGTRGSASASYESFLAVAFPHDEMRILDYNRVVRDLNGSHLRRAARALARVVRRRAERGSGRTRAAGDVRLVRGGALVSALDPLGARAAHGSRCASLDVSLLQDRRSRRS